MAGRKPKTAAAGAEVVSALMFKDYEIVVMNRSDIHGAEYNPRVMSDAQRKRLRAGVKKHGNLMPPNVNKRSVEKGWPEGSVPTLVGGHQRLSIFDALAGTQNYKIEVALVDKTPAEEKEANVLLNNPSAQGDWELDLLGSILQDPNVDVAGTGFDLAEVMQLFGDIPGASQPDVEELASKLRSFQEAYAKVSDNVGRDDFYLVFIFRDFATRAEFLRDAGMEDNRYQDGARLKALLVPRQSSDQGATKQS